MESRTSPNSTATHKKNKNYIFGGVVILLVAVIFVVAGFLYLNYSKSVNTNSLNSVLINTPKISYETVKQEQRLTAFTKQVLKPQFVPKSFDLTKEVHLKESYIAYTAETGNINNYKFSFLSETDLGAKDLGQYIVGDFRVKNSDSKEVINILNTYFILPENASEIIKRKLYPGSKLIGYEIMLTHNSNYLDSIIAYVVTESKNQDSLPVRVGACHIKAEAPEFKNNSCLKPE